MMLRGFVTGGGTRTPNKREKDAQLFYIMEFASSRFAASWMPSNIYSGERDELFCAGRYLPLRGASRTGCNSVGCLLSFSQARSDL